MTTFYKPLLLHSDLQTQCSNNIIQTANEAEQPYINFLYASNASLPGRVYMTINGQKFKTCINTVTSFFNKYHTCSNCEDFVKNPDKWGFVKVETPQVGDIIILHDSKDNRAYHAVLLVDIKNKDYYVNHANRMNYYKNQKLKKKKNLSFYRYKKLINKST